MMLIEIEIEREIERDLESGGSIQRCWVVVKKRVIVDDDGWFDVVGGDVDVTRAASE